jgi:hypothetical protein
LNGASGNQNVVVDLGFGFSKGKCGDRYFLQPSVIGEPRELLEEQVRMEDIIFDGQHFIGELALRQSKFVYYSMEENKAKNKVTEILMRSAISCVAEPNKKINLVTGLPFSMHSSQKDQMIKLINDINHKECSSYIVKEGNNSLIVEIENYKVLAQGFGAAMNYLLDDNGKLLRVDEAKKRILVVDIGFYTLDLIILEGMEINKKSRSDSELGVSALYEVIMEHLKGKRPQIHLLDQCVRNKEFDGYDISKLVDRAFEGYSRQIESVINGFNMNFHKIILSGGVAPEVSKYLNYQNLYLSENPQFDNLLGYEKVAKRLWNNEK